MSSLVDGHEDVLSCLWSVGQILMLKSTMNFLKSQSNRAGWKVVIMNTKLLYLLIGGIYKGTHLRIYCRHLFI